MTKKNGFSLLELLIVLVVLGVITSIAFPRYTFHKARMHFEAAVDGSKAVFDLAKGYSTALNRVVRVSINKDTQNKLMDLSVIDVNPPDSSTGNVLEQLILRDPWVITISPSTVEYIDYYPHESVKLLNAGKSLVSDSENCSIGFVMEYSSRTLSANVVIYSQSGSSKLYKNY
ncbi:prepilin-type N-terminal cleavage/methylation domain-containing protein [Thermoproteota archaeon]